MANRKRTRKVHFRQAVFDNSAGEQNLQSGFERAWTKLKNQEYRQVKDSGGRILRCINRQPSKHKGILLHIVAFSHGSEMSQVSNNSKATETETMKPRQGTEFLEGDLAVLIRSNDVLIIGSSLREGSCSKFLRQLSIQAECPPVEQQFSLEPQLRHDKLALIKREGVQAVRFNGVVGHLEKAAIEEHATRSQNFLSQTLSGIGSFFLTQDSLAKIRQSKYAKIDVVLRVDKKGSMLTFDEMTALASSIVGDEQDDLFTLTLQNGKGSIKSSDVAVAQEVNLGARGNSVSINDAFSALEDFHRRLIEDGLAIA